MEPSGGRKLGGYIGVAVSVRDGDGKDVGLSRLKGVETEGSVDHPVSVGAAGGIIKGDGDVAVCLTSANCGTCHQLVSGRMDGHACDACKEPREGELIDGLLVDKGCLGGGDVIAIYGDHLHLGGSVIIVCRYGSQCARLAGITPGFPWKEKREDGILCYTAGINSSRERGLGRVRPAWRGTQRADAGSSQENLYVLTGRPVCVECAAYKFKGLGVVRLVGLKGEPEASFRDICGGSIPD